MRERITSIEVQLKRVVSDMESEKRTRATINADIEARLRHIEKMIYIGIGGLAVLQALFAFIK